MDVLTRNPHKPIEPVEPVQFYEPSQTLTVKPKQLNSTELPRKKINVQVSPPLYNINGVSSESTLGPCIFGAHFCPIEPDSAPAASTSSGHNGMNEGSMVLRSVNGLQVNSQTPCKDRQGGPGNVNCDQSLSASNVDDASVVNRDPHQDFSAKDSSFIGFSFNPKLSLSNLKEVKENPLESLLCSPIKSNRCASPVTSDGPRNVVAINLQKAKQKAKQADTSQNGNSVQVNRLNQCASTRQTSQNYSSPPPPPLLLDQALHQAVGSPISKPVPVSIPSGQSTPVSKSRISRIDLYTARQECHSANGKTSGFASNSSGFATPSSGGTNGGNLNLQSQSVHETFKFDNPFNYPLNNGKGFIPDKQDYSQNPDHSNENVPQSIQFQDPRTGSVIEEGEGYQLCKSHCLTIRMPQFSFFDRLFQRLATGEN